MAILDIVRKQLSETLYLSFVKIYLFMKAKDHTIS